MLLGNRTQADKDYYDSLPNASICGYGLIQVSKRRWAIIQPDGVATVYFGCKEVPRYIFVEGMESLSHGEAVERLTALCKIRELEILQAHLKNGARYLDTLTDEELSKLPLGPISDAGLDDYIRTRSRKLVHVLGKGYIKMHQFVEGKDKTVLCDFCGVHYGHLVHIEKQ